MSDMHDPYDPPNGPGYRLDMGEVRRHLADQAALQGQQGDGIRGEREQLAAVEGYRIAIRKACVIFLQHNAFCECSGCADIVLRLAPTAALRGPASVVVEGEMQARSGLHNTGISGAPETPAPSPDEGTR